MKKLATILLFLLSGCVTESAIPLGNDMAQIDVSAAPIYGRAGAVRIAMENAARATLDLGYDKFIVLGNEGWNEAGASGGSYGAFNANGNMNGVSASGSEGGFFATHRNPEAKMVIKMFHNGDKGSSKAIDARSLVKAQNIKRQQANQ